jgi:hypothetical protein
MMTLPVGTQVAFIPDAMLIEGGFLQNCETRLILWRQSLV